MFAPASRLALYLLVMQQTGGCIGETIAYEFPTAGNQIQPGNAVELQLLWRTSWGPRVSPPRRVRNSRFGHRQELRIDGGQSGGIAESTALLNRSHLQQIIAV